MASEANQDENKTNDDVDNSSASKLPSIDTHTPLTILNNNLQPYLNDKNYTFAVLLTTGALNPIHLGHVDIMEAAKTEIEKTDSNIKVIAGFLSASHDHYLGGKFGSNRYIPSSYRAKMIAMATEHSNWLCADEWECKQQGFVDFPYVSAKLIQKLRRIYCSELKYIQPSKLQIYYVCGLDHARKCGLLHGMSVGNERINVLIVRRPTAALKKVHLQSKEGKGVFVVNAPPVDYDRSSSLVRDLVQAKKWKELDKYLHPKVLQYLKQDPDKVLRYIS